MGARTRLQEFEEAFALARNGDIGNALHDSLEKATIRVDGAEFAQGVLTLDMSELAPFLLIWREELIAAILEEQT